MKKLKNISAVFLATGLIASTSIHALANNTEKADTSNFETVNLQDAFTSVKNESTQLEDLQVIVANIPVGLSSNNIFALSTNIEKINNPQEKQRAHELKKAEKEVAKEARKAAKLIEKQERKAAQQAKKEAHKATQQVKKGESKASQLEKKEEHKAKQKVKKEERKASNHEKKDGKDNK